MLEAAAVPPEGDSAASANPAAASARLAAMPAAAPRIPLCFARTELGDQQVRHGQVMLPLHVARLLLLFEGPQTVEDLRRMIDEPWLPEALIELERRRLIHRIAPALPAQDLSLAGMQMRSPAGMQMPRSPSMPLASSRADSPLRADPLPPAKAPRHGSGDAVLDRRRAMTRVMFLRLLGSLGSDMARRIDQCRSDSELDELMPQVDALIEAIAGHDALGLFRQQTTRSS
jgi:hypothetical protein